MPTEHPVMAASIIPVQERSLKNAKLIAKKNRVSAFIQPQSSGNTFLCEFADNETLPSGELQSDCHRAGRRGDDPRERESCHQDSG